MKKKDKKKNIKHFLYEDSKKDTFLNPTKWEHLEVWRKIYDLSFKEVITAMQKYYESATGDKFDHKVAKYTPIKFDKFEESTFLICKVIEDYKYNHPNTSTRQAISNCQKKITELLKKRKLPKGIKRKEDFDKNWSIDQIDALHRRLVKKRSKLFDKWIVETNAHKDLI
jgi:hypothetical protein